jgi:hypothetical protein
MKREAQLVIITHKPRLTVIPLCRPLLHPSLIVHFALIADIAMRVLKDKILLLLTEGVYENPDTKVIAILREMFEEIGDQAGIRLFANDRDVQSHRPRARRGHEFLS